MAISEEQRIKLESMQIKGIRWMIWNNIERESIESRLLQLKGQSCTNDLDKLVNSQSRVSLIRLIEISPEINATTIDFAYEKYRYGLKPGFTLFWAKGHQQTAVSKEMLETYLKSSKRSGYLRSITFCLPVSTYTIPSLVVFSYVS